MPALSAASASACRSPSRLRSPMPGRQVISVNGDGAFGINAMEIDTAVRHGAKCVFIVSNNAAWNIERLDQEMNYGGRVVGTTLRHSDYAAMARALGLHGERVEKPKNSCRRCSGRCRTRRRWSTSSPRSRCSHRTRRKGLALCPTIRRCLRGTRPSKSAASRSLRSVEVGDGALLEDGRLVQVFIEGVKHHRSGRRHGCGRGPEQPRHEKRRRNGEIGEVLHHWRKRGPRQPVPMAQSPPILPKSDPKLSGT